MFEAPSWIRPVAVIAAIFGILTIYAGGMALFGSAAVQAAAGDAVPLVLWFNFFAGFAYIIGAIALYSYVPLGLRAAWLIGVCNLLVFAVLIALALMGTAFEWRTIGAMILRTSFWLVIAITLSKYEIRKRRSA